jgi:ATP-dependent DNA ligase
MAAGARLPLLAPMLAAAARALPADETSWSAEFKWDGMLH